MSSDLPTASPAAAPSGEPAIFTLDSVFPAQRIRWWARTLYAFAIGMGALIVFILKLLLERLI